MAAAVWLAWPSLGLSALSLWERTDLLLYGGLTAALGALVLLRPAPQAQDARPGVILLCALSSFYWLGYDLGPAQAIVLGLHWLGDVTLLFLGRSFAVLPALRRVVTVGPYRWVRHPVYSTYLLADLFSVGAYPSLRNAAVLAFGAATLLARIRLEERLLVQVPEYRHYAAKTRYRLLPGVY